MAKTISTFFTVLMLLLAPPSAAALATWNTLPGQPLYPIKRGLESAALIILSPSFQAKSSLQSELVSRRTSEAVKLLATSESTQGLDELRAEIDAAKEQAAKANDPTARREAAERLIAKLQAANQALNSIQAPEEDTTQTTRPAGYGTGSAPTNTYTPPPTTNTINTTDIQPQTQVINTTQTNVIYKTTVVNVIVKQQVVTTQTQIQQDIQQLQQEAQQAQEQEQEQERDNNRGGRGRDNDDDKDEDVKDDNDNNDRQEDRDRDDNQEQRDNDRGQDRH